MIENIRIRNLRSIHDSGIIKFKPIMILLGANSSGKSTFLRSFPLFTQSVDKKLRGPISWFDSAYVDYGDYKTAKNRFADENEGISFEYTYSDLVSIDRRRFYFRQGNYVYSTELKKGSFSFELKGDSKGTFISKISIETVNVSFVLSVNDRNDNINFVINGKAFKSPEKLFFNFNTAFGILPSIASNKSSNSDNDVSGYSLIYNRLIGILKEQCDKRLRNTQRLEVLLSTGNLDKSYFLSILKHGNAITSMQKNVKDWTTKTPLFNEIYNYFLLLKINPIIAALNEEIATFYHRCDYIAPMRAEAGRFYRIQGLQVDTVDPSGHNLLEFIASLTEKEKKSFDDFISGILKVTVDVPSESGMKSLRIKTVNGEFSLADVGYGYSQVLPVISKLWHTTYVMENNSSLIGRLRFREFDKNILLMEQPELHLHPAMQAKVADTLIATVDRTREADECVTLIVETHSQAIINRIGRRIREGIIQPDDVNVILFSKDSNLQNTIIKQISYTEQGQLKDWPYGFFDPQD